MDRWNSAAADAAGGGAPPCAPASTRADAPVAGKKSEHSDVPHVADGMSSAWWLDADVNTLYNVQNGGFAGFQNSVSSVVAFES